MSRYIAIFSSNPLSLARALSSRVEIHPSGAVVVAVADRYEQPTLERLLQLSSASGRVDFASASTRTVALFAARARPGTRVPPGQEAAFLAPFPVQLLRLLKSDEGESKEEQELESTFSRWGIRTLGELARLPRAALVARLGEKGGVWQRLARGEDRRPFQAQQDQPIFEEKQELEWELDSLEALAFALASILERICTKLTKRGLAASRLDLTMRLADGSIYRRDLPLACPMREPKTLLSLLRLKLQSEPPQAAIKTVRVGAEPTRPRALQHTILDTGSANPEKLSRTLARLGALAGQEQVGSPQLQDTHRPDSFRMTPFRVAGPRLSKTESESFNPCAQLALRRIRPPVQTQVRPEQVVACAGPWRTSGEWWKGKSIAGPPTLLPADDTGWWRDEWDIELTNGKICRVFWDHQMEKWFLEGVYD